MTARSGPSLTLTRLDFAPNSSFFPFTPIRDGFPKLTHQLDVDLEFNFEGFVRERILMKKSMRLGASRRILKRYRLNLTSQPTTTTTNNNNTIEGSPIIHLLLNCNIRSRLEHPENFVYDAQVGSQSFTLVDIKEVKLIFKPLADQENEEQLFRFLSSNVKNFVHATMEHHEGHEYYNTINVVCDIITTKEGKWNALVRSVFNDWEEEEEEEDSSSVVEEGGVVDDQEMCTVCLDEIGRDRRWKLELGCSHYFHFYCIHPWLERKKSCPYCRCEQPIFTTEDCRDILSLDGKLPLSWTRKSLKILV